MNRDVVVVTVALVIGFAVACALPTAPTKAEQMNVGALPSIPADLRVVFSEHAVGWPEPTFYGEMRTDVYGGGISTPKITSRENSTTYASAWSLVLFKLSDNNEGVSPVCVDNRSGELVRCSARVQ